MRLFNRARPIDKAVSDSPEIEQVLSEDAEQYESPNLGVNVLNHMHIYGSANTEKTFDEMLESLWGSDITPQREEMLGRALNNLEKLGLVRKSEGGYHLTKLSEEYLEKRTVEIYDLDNYQRPLSMRVSRYIGNITWSFLNRIERTVDPHTNREPLENEIKIEFLSAFDNRFYFFISLLVIPLIILSTLDLCLIINPQVYGLLLDLEGATILALSLIRGLSGITLESEGNLVAFDSYFDTTYSPTDVMTESYKTIDAVWGSTLLIIGFSIQILAISGIFSAVFPTLPCPL